MPKIMPISDLRNNINQVSEICHSNAEPVYITKNGKGDLVVTSHEYFENIQARLAIYEKIAEAEAQLVNGDATLPYGEVMDRLRSKYNVK